MAQANAPKSMQSDTSIAANEGSLENTIKLEFGLFPLRGEQNWKPTYSIRTGIRTRLSHRISLCGYVDYYMYSLGIPGGTYGFSPYPANRQDVALYAALLFSEFLEFGFGAYYSRSDKIYEVESGVRTALSSVNSATSVHPFMMIGFQYEVRLSDRLLVPIGLYYRGTDYGTETIPLILRTGLGFKF